MLEELRTKSLDISLKETPTRWHVTHKDNLEAWEQVRRMMKVTFGHNPKYLNKQYTRVESPSMHIDTRVTICKKHNELEE